MSPFTHSCQVRATVCSVVGTTDSLRCEQRKPWNLYFWPPKWHQQAQELLTPILEESRGGRAVGLLLSWPVLLAAGEGWFLLLFVME